MFETCDLPESDQHLEPESEAASTSDSVEVLHVSANEAFGRFRGKSVDARGVDFSDRLRPTKNKKG